MSEEQPDQTVVDGEHGDCLRAAVATITGADMIAVPNFSTFKSEWFSALMTWCEGNGFEVYPVNPDHVPAERVLAIGTSPRNVRHAVVWQGGAMLHDPHPSRAGLTDVDGFWLIDRV